MFPVSRHQSVPTSLHTQSDLNTNTYIYIYNMCVCVLNSGVSQKDGYHDTVPKNGNGA